MRNACGVFLQTVDTFVAVRHVGRVAHVVQRLPREPLYEGFGDSQATDARIKNADGRVHMPSLVFTKSVTSSPPLYKVTPVLVSKMYM